MINEGNIDAEYIGRDLGGYPFNKVFPPNVRVYGTHHGGYPSDVAQVFFYDYIVQGYGVLFSYNGKNYVIQESDNCTLVNLTDKTEILFESPIDLIRNAKVEGISLLKLIEENHLENVDIQ